MRTWQLWATGSAPGGTDHLRIDRQTVDSVTVFSLIGELDARSAPAVQEQIGDGLTGMDPVLLDMSELAYISSAGLRAMLMLHRRATQAGVAVALVGVRPRLLSILSATGFIRFFQVAADVPDGVAVLRRSGPARRPTRTDH